MPDINAESKRLQLGAGERYRKEMSVNVSDRSNDQGTHRLYGCREEGYVAILDVQESNVP